MDNDFTSPSHQEGICTKWGRRWCNPRTRNVINQNKILQEAVARLENENISLNNRIPTLERIILGRRDEFSMNNKVEKTILGKSDEFSMNNKGVSHNWCKYL